MPVWPADLPQYASWRSFKEQLPAGTIRTAVDVGPAKSRRRTTAGKRSLTLSLTCTEAQVASLRTFYDFTTLKGTLDFDWVHPRTQAPATMTFLDRPQFVPRGALTYTASFPIEIIDQAP